MRLAHGWTLNTPANTAPDAVSFVRPAVRALPRALVRRLLPCTIVLEEGLEGDAASRWTIGEGSIEIALAIRDADPHDVALELLLCVGQILWEIVTLEQRDAWLRLLRAEMEGGVAGEIDEDALREKRRLLSGRTAATSGRRLQAYARASFAGTVAEYVHALWHDVTIRSGPEHLSAAQLRRRLELLASYFPPDRGYRLFPPAPG